MHVMSYHIHPPYQAEEPVDVDADDEDAQLQQIELDMRMARLEDLMSRRPLLLSSVLLRQNPHNVDVSIGGCSVACGA